MKNLLTTFSVAVLVSFTAAAQTFNLSDGAQLFVGGDASFFFGGNTTLNGVLNNQGTIVSFSDLNFVANTDAGSIKFNGTGDQQVFGEGLVFKNFTVDKTGSLFMRSAKMNISGAFTTLNGVIKTGDVQEFIISGAGGGAGDGYIEGRVIGITSGVPITFPMGINGYPNYITFSDMNPGIKLDVRIAQPDPGSLLPDEDIVGIADQVEWLVATADGSSSEASVTVNFSGIDLQNFTNGQTIRAEAYEPAIVVYSADDTLYHTLPGVLSDASANQTESFGVYEGLEKITLSGASERISIALIPIQLRPFFFVPNSFAPNATLDENRLFRPFFSGEKVSSVIMRVFDSLNKEVYVYSQNGADLDISLMGWNGTMPSGAEAPNGVYYYTIQLQAEMENHNKSGAVLLVK